MLRLIPQGRISKWFSAYGQEAISVGCTLALNDDDYILPDLPFRIAGPADRTHEIGAMIPVARGFGLSAPLRGDRTVTLVLFGEGASREGDFHEARGFGETLRLLARWV